MASNARPEDFRKRARLEAARYGPDPWVFVRELLQNARDAGATKVRFEVSIEGRSARLLCRDDGEGMGIEHARRYLFSLYASSKETSRDQVGRFGVGFWSILRFEPRLIIIRSRRRDQDAWEMVLDGGLETALQRVPSMSVGTEVVLERVAVDGQLARRVRDAARQNARFLCMRDDPARALEITVNGERVNVDFTLPAPSASFRRGRVRGVVGLGNAARVELFSRGLRVRSASSLEEFLSVSGRHTDRSRVQFTELPGRLAPQALLESDAIELVLSRSDARENRALRRLIELAQRELERLVNRQIDAIRPLPWVSRIWGALAGALRGSLAWRMFAASIAGAILALGLAYWMWGDRLTRSFGLGASAADGVYAGRIDSEGGHGELPGGGRYRDLASYYGGPQVDVLDGGGAPMALSYEPPDQELRFAALIFERFATDGTPETVLEPNALTPYVTTACAATSACVRVTLEIWQPPGFMRIPIPTGHRLDVASVTLDGEPGGARLGAVRSSRHGEPVVLVERELRGVLRYVTSPARPPGELAIPVGNDLPAELRELASGLRVRPVHERVATLVDEVRTRVHYSTEPAVQALHAQARAAGQGFIERTLALQAGDCDMQNGLLVALLQHAEVPARLAVGFVGREGHTTEWFHAWVEYRDGEARGWMIADASESFRPPALASDEARAGPAVAGLEEGAGAPERSGPDAGVAEGAAAVGSAAAAADPGEGAALDRDERTEGAALDAVSEPVLAVASSSTRAVALSGLERWGPWALGSTIALLIVILMARTRRTRRTIALDRGQDLSRLLQGALQQPDAFRSMPAVFQRPLIPLAGGKVISLDRAKALAASGRLFRTLERSELAKDAIAGGATVLDDHEAESRIVADALGAIDLDEWGALLTRGRVLPLLDAINEYFEEVGVRWRVLASSAIETKLRTLDLAALRLRRSSLRAKRVIVVDGMSLWIKDYTALLATQPRLAVFSALDMIVDRLELTPEQHGRVLSRSANEALLEAIGR